MRLLLTMPLLFVYLGVISDKCIDWPKIAFISKMPAVVTTPAYEKHFYLPTNITAIGDTLYVTDSGNNRICKLNPDNSASTVSGGFPHGYKNAVGYKAKFNFPVGITAIGDTFYVVDTGNDCIRKITPDGAVTTFAGSPKRIGNKDGPGNEASFEHPEGIVAVRDVLYVADRLNRRIRKITPDGVVTAFVGFEWGYDDGVGIAAKFTLPTGITAIGNTLYVTDGHRIRKITPGGVVTTLAGSEQGNQDGFGAEARFNYPYGITAIGDNLYVSDTDNNRICKITPDGNVTTIAGSEKGNADGIGKYASFYIPKGLVALGNTLYVADQMNHRIRKIDLLPDPTSENRNRKRAALEELIYLPKMSVFPGGIQFQEAEQRFQNTQRRNRKTRKRKNNMH